MVNIGATVTDRKGSLVADLALDDFEIYEDGQKQTIRYFAAGDGDDSAPPMHLGLMLDVSGSMGEDLAFAKTAAIKFLNMLTDAVDITVVDFDTEVRAARYSQNEFARLIERIRQKKASGFTALYDAVGLYLDGASGQDGRKIMLIYTDGGDTRSAISFQELMTSSGRPTSPSIRSGRSIISLHRAGTSSACCSSRWPRSPAGRRSFRASSKSSTACTTR